MAVHGTGPRHGDGRPRFLRRVVNRMTAVGFEHRRVSDVRYDVDTAHERLNSHQVRLDDHHVRLRRIDAGPAEVATRPEGEVLAQVLSVLTRIEQRQDDHHARIDAALAEFLEEFRESAHRVSDAASRLRDELP